MATPSEPPAPAAATAATPAAATDRGDSPLIRLRGIRRARLPAPEATGPALAPFLTALLREAAPFIDSAAPKANLKPGSGSGSSPTTGAWKRKATKTHADSAAAIEVSERWVETPASPTEDGGGSKSGRTKEMWCARRSVHEDAARTGSASWAEFDRAFRTDHAASELAFTPNALAAHEAVVWDCAGVNVGLPSPSPSDGDAATYGNFRLAIMEMRHRVGTGLKDRTFPVLQMSCYAVSPGTDAGTATGGGGNQKVEDEFFVISVPVPDFGDDPRSKLAAEPDALVAAYVSVERIRKLPAVGEDGKGGAAGSGGSIEWLMATAGDAGGILPAWIQNIAMPAVIWKDVPLFLSWIAKERVKSGGVK